MAAPLSLDEYINKPLAIEKEVKHLLAYSEKQVLFDIGACEGEDAIKYARLSPDVRVFAFEPRPDNYEKATNLIKRHRAESVRLFPFALSNENGTATFHVSSGRPEGTDLPEDWDFGNKSSSLLPPGSASAEHHPWLKFEQTIQVETRRLDEFCLEQGLNKIDFIHLDVQGAELMVLEGAGAMIKSIGSIWMEVESVELYDQQPLKEDVEAFMRENGFTCIISTVDAVSGDQLYLNTSFYDEETIRKLKAMQQHKQKSIRNVLSKIYRRIRHALS